MGVISVDTLAIDLANILKSIKSKFFRFFDQDKIDNHHQDEKEVWALKNINLNIKEGEIVGLIGRNGAGKSTLLKIVSRITTPTIGSVKNQRKNWLFT